LKEDEAEACRLLLLVAILGFDEETAKTELTKSVNIFFKKKVLK
jgi:hypothetical protein